METDEARAAEHVATLNAKLDGYEKLLSNQTFLAGNVSIGLHPSNAAY